MQPHFLRPSRLPNGRTAIIATTKAAAEFKMEERREGQGLVIRSCPLPEPTPESLSEPSQKLVEQLKVADLSEDATQTLSDLLTLKVEINRHKALGRDYEPPESGQRLDDVYEGLSNNPWTVINAVRHGAQRIYDTAGRLGLSIMSYWGDDYEAGRDLFPNLSDRMHLGAVLAKCGDFMARAEQMVKHVLNPDVPKYDLRSLWPQEAYGQVERHEINLGLVVPQQEHSITDRRGVEIELDEGDEKERDVGIARDTGYSI